MDIFAPWRAKYPELLVAPTRQINLDVDQKKAFNYSSSKFKQLTLPDLIQILSIEIDTIQNLNVDLN